jgi:hypothetical protein
MYWGSDTIAMARATYDVLARYPQLSQTPRKPRSWDELRPLLDRFIAAATKTEKKRWFNAQGIDDVSFLGSISLPDGSEPFLSRWPGRRLPPLESARSRQHEVPADLLDFYNRFFARWISGTDFEAIATEFGPMAGVRANDAAMRARRADLVGRLKVWRLRDHGRASAIAHSIAPLTPQQHAELVRIAKEPDAYVSYASPSDAFFPLLPRGKDVSPLLPFFVSTKFGSDAHSRAVAVTKLRHVPYDALGVVAEQSDGHWHIVSIVAVVDH